MSPILQNYLSACIHTWYVIRTPFIHKKLWDPSVVHSLSFHHWLPFLLFVCSVAFHRLGHPIRLSRAGLLKVCDEILTLRGLLDSSKDHLGSLWLNWNELKRWGWRRYMMKSKRMEWTIKWSDSKDGTRNAARLEINKSRLHSTPLYVTHLHVLLGVLEIIEQGVLTPHDSALLVGTGVVVTWGLSGLTTEESVEVGSLLVRAALLDSVALWALGLEYLGSLLLTWFLCLLCHLAWVVWCCLVFCTVDWNCQVELSIDFQWKLNVLFLFACSFLRKFSPLASPHYNAPYVLLTGRKCFRWKKKKKKKNKSPDLTNDWLTGWLARMWLWVSGRQWTNRHKHPRTDAIHICPLKQEVLYRTVLCSS